MIAIPTTSQELLADLRRSGVADATMLEDCLRALPGGGEGPRDAPAFADVLVSAGIVTRYQAGQLLRGRGRRLTVGNKYTILQPLGAGGMGKVYLSRHRLLGRRVALKVLPASRAKDPETRRRFYREARAAARLDHPNIARAYDVGHDRGRIFLVLEYVEGRTLEEVVADEGPLPVGRAVGYARQVAAGLKHAHEAGLVHRDVKPSNLIVDAAGTVKILDMGLALFFNEDGDNLTKEQKGRCVLGTLDYVAPEQFRDSHRVDFRADLYGLGGTLYFVLAGRTPFGEGSFVQQFLWNQVREPVPLGDLRPETPGGLRALVARLMAKDPGDRYQTAAELLVGLASWSGSTLPPVGLPPAVRAAPPVPGRFRRALAAVAGLPCKLALAAAARWGK